MDGERKHIIGFFVFSCLSVYSQYGAVFIILPLYGTMMIHYLRKKEKIRELLILSGLAAIVAGLLVVFFLLPQLSHQGTSGVSHSPVFKKGNPVVDFLYSTAFCLGFTSGHGSYTILRQPFHSMGTMNGTEAGEQTILSEDTSFS